MNFTHQIKKNDLGDTCSMNVGELHIGFAGETQRKERLERLRHGWEDSIKLEIQEIGLGQMYS